MLVMITILTTLTLTTTIAVAYAGGDNDDNGDRDGNKQKAEDDSAAAIADCDHNDVERAGFDCIAVAEIVRDGGTTPPDRPFTITGIGSEGSIGCHAIEYFIEFSAQGDGTVTGTYRFQNAADSPIAPGVITEGTTDGSTYTLSGEGLILCFSGPGNPILGETTISGDCGDDVTITYEDLATAATFTGDVDCALL